MRNYTADIDKRMSITKSVIQHMESRRTMRNVLIITYIPEVSRVEP